jgi:hypothetical protein
MERQFLIQMLHHRFVTNSNINLKETHEGVHCKEAVLDSFNPQIIIL